MFSLVILSSHVLVGLAFEPTSFGETVSRTAEEEDRVDEGEDGYPEAPFAAGTAPGVAEEPPGVQFGAVLQAWAVPYVGGDAQVAALDPVEVRGFRLRRADFFINGQISPWASYHAVLFLQNDSPSVHSVYIAFMAARLHKNLSAHFGVLRVPFTYVDINPSARAQLYDWPSTARMMTDLRSMGVALDGTLGDWFSWRTGFYNSAPVFVFGQPEPGYQVAGRVELHPMGPVGPYESDLEGGPLRAGLGVGALFNDGEALTRRGLAADLRVKWEGFAASGAVMMDRRTPLEQDDPVVDPVIPREDDRLALHAQAGYFLLFPLLELAFRYESMDGTLDDLLPGSSFHLYTAGLNWFVDTHRVKVSLNGNIRREQDAPQLSNDSIILLVQASLL